MDASGMTFGQNDSGLFEFFAPQRRYRVTKFQRSYTWEKYQVQGLLEDLIYIDETGKAVGWPSILLEKKPKDPLKPNIQFYDIGDGQQRVVTISLLLLVIWQRATVLSDQEGEKPDFVSEIVPTEEGKSRTGVIATREIDKYTGMRISPHVTFQSKSANKAFERLFYRLNGPDWEIIEKTSLGKDTDSISLIFRAYHQMTEFFIRNNSGLKDLEKFFESVKNMFILTVLEYENDENMQRAFSNMNSFGIGLSESELVKSEVYGVLKSKNPSAADLFADQWTDNLQTSFWREQWSEKTKEKFLDYCLKQSLQSYDLLLETDGRRFKDLWPEHIARFDSVIDFKNQFWDDIRIFETALGREAYHPGTLKWEINYCYQIIGATGGVPKILQFLMRMSRVMTEQDFVRSMHLITKYFLYISFVTDNRNFIQTLTKSDSPFLNSTFSVKDIENYILGLSTEKTRWRNESYIEKKLSEVSFGNSMNPLISELFIYANNELKRKNNLIESLSTTRGLPLDKAREHILPQKPSNHASFTEKQKIDHEFIVGLLGNTLILDSTRNNTLKNKSPEIKANSKEYIDSQEHLAWGSYVRDFLKFYSERDAWGKEEIEIRSREIAKKISPTLAPSKTSSIQKPVRFALLDNFEAGQLFYLKFKSKEDELEDTYLEIELTEESTFKINQDGEEKDVVLSIGDLYLEAGYTKTRPGNFNKYFLIKIGNHYRSLDAISSFIDWNKPFAEQIEKLMKDVEEGTILEF